MVCDYYFVPRFAGHCGRNWGIPPPSSRCPFPRVAGSFGHTPPHDPPASAAHLSDTSGKNWSFSKVAILVPAGGFVLPPFRAAPWGAEADFCRLSFHTFHPAKICCCRPALQDKEAEFMGLNWHLSFYKGCSPCALQTCNYSPQGE